MEEQQRISLADGPRPLEIKTVLCFISTIRESRCGVSQGFDTPHFFRRRDMAISQKERDKLPDEDFGDPKRKLFPVKKPEDVKSSKHLIGKAHDPEAVKGRIKAIAKRKGKAFEDEIPEDWKDAEMSTVNFSTSFILASQNSNKEVIDGQTYIRRKAPLIFKTGDYEDKEFSMSPEEMAETVAEFSPVNIGLEHIPTVLSGRLGRIVAVGQDYDNPSVMYGEALIPEWLDKAVPAGEKKLSAAFDRKSKRMIGCDLVISPRVNGACLLAKFSKEPGAIAALEEIKKLESPKRPFGVRTSAANRTKVGQKAMEKMHSKAAKFGAVCRPMKSADMSDEQFAEAMTQYEIMHAANFASDHERGKVQRIHDIACEGAHFCKFNCDDKPGFSDEDAEFTEDEATFAKYSGPSKKQTTHGQQAMQKLHKSAVKFGADCTSAKFGDGGASSEERGKLQRMHDISAEGKKFCAGMAGSTEGPPDPEKTAEGPIPMKPDDSHPPVEAVEESNPAAVKPQTEFFPPKGFSKPSFAGSRPMAESAAFAKPEQHDEATVLLAQSNQALAEMNAALQVERMARIQSEAAAFAKDEVINGRIMNCEADVAVFRYVQAAKDDMAMNDTPVFNGKPMSRLDAVKAEYALRQPHVLTKELMPTNGKTQVLFNESAKPKDGRLSDEQLRAMRMKTSLGKACVAMDEKDAKRNGKA